jgi:hypothetical protein
MRYNKGMTFDELESEALKLDAKARARLAGRLLESLEALSEPEIAEQWAEEAERRDADLAAYPESGRAAADVLRDARARLT